MATCVTPILNATRVGEHIVFTQKDAAATIFSSLTQYGDYSKAVTIKWGVYSRNTVNVVEPSLVSKREP